MAENNTIRFKVQLTAKDLWRFSLYHANKGMMGVFNGIFTAASVFLLVTRWTTLESNYRVMLIICALMFTVWQPATLYYKAMKQSKRPEVKEPMELVFAEDGAEVFQDGKNMNVPWDQIAKVVKTRSMVVVYLDRVHAYLITNEQMGDQKEAFLAMVREHVPAHLRKGV